MAENSLSILTSLEKQGQVLGRFFRAELEMDLASIYYEQGNLGDAEALARTTLDKIVDTLGSGVADGPIAGFTCFIAKIFMEQRKLEEAWTMTRRALDMLFSLLMKDLKKNSLFQDHNITDSLLLTTKEIEGVLKKCIGIIEKFHEDNLAHPDVIATIKVWAFYYHRVGRHEDAVESIMLCIEGLEENYGKIRVILNLKQQVHSSKVFYLLVKRLPSSTPIASRKTKTRIFDVLQRYRKVMKVRQPSFEDYANTRS